MRALISCVIACVGLLLTTIAFALPPVVNYNVEVMQKATPAQCNNWRGQIGPEENSVSVMSQGGMTDYGSPGIRTCTGCSVNASGNCICKTCYDYTDNL